MGEGCEKLKNRLFVGSNSRAAYLNDHSGTQIMLRTRTTRR